MPKPPVKKARKIYLTPQEDAELEKLARLRTKEQGELVEPSPLARELLVPAIREQLAQREQAAA